MVADDLIFRIFTVHIQATQLSASVRSFSRIFQPFTFRPFTWGDNSVMVICLITSFMDDPFHVCVMCGGCIEVPRMLRP